MFAISHKMLIYMYIYIFFVSKHKPHWMMLVPRVLEKVALGVQDKFSKKSKLARIMIQ